MKRWHTTVAVLAVATLGLAACGGDDGAGVREIDGSGEASGSSSASGSASGSMSGSASTTESASEHGSEHGSASTAHAEAECLPIGDPTTADTTVSAALTEWAIATDPTTVSAGAIAFDVSNDGEHPHELVVIRTDTPAAELPTGEDGAVDEAALDGELIGEVEPFPAGENCVGVFDLAPGNYALICDIAEEHDGEPEVHYAEGMYADFVVS